MIFVHVVINISSVNLKFWHRHILTVTEKYKNLWDVLQDRTDYEPISLLDTEPEDKLECVRWIKNISLPFENVTIFVSIIKTSAGC